MGAKRQKEPQWGEWSILNATVRCSCGKDLFNREQDSKTLEFTGVAFCYLSPLFDYQTLSEFHPASSATLEILAMGIGGQQGVAGQCPKCKRWFRLDKEIARDIASKLGRGYTRSLFEGWEEARTLVLGYTSCLLEIWEEGRKQSREEIRQWFEEEEREPEEWRAISSEFLLDQLKETIRLEDELQVKYRGKFRLQQEKLRDYDERKKREYTQLKRSFFEKYEQNSSQKG